MAIESTKCGRQGQTSPPAECQEFLQCGDRRGRDEGNFIRTGEGIFERLGRSLIYTPGGTLTRRFGVSQKGKVRPIDDHKASFVNASVTSGNGDNSRGRPHRLFDCAHHEGGC